MEKKMEIRKGMRFLCTKDVVMNGTLELFYYKEGCIYLSEVEGCITDEVGDDFHVWLDEYSDSEWEDDPEDYFVPLQEVEYVCTEATPELKKLFENYKGKREGQRKDMSKVYYFSNKAVNPQDTAFTAHEYFDPILDGAVYFMTPDTFIEHLGLSNDSEKQTQKRLLEKMMDADEDSGIYEEDDPVNSPSHYAGKIEVIEFIEDKELGFHLGNSVKYISRAGKKDPRKTEEDLKKAIWYIERYIEIYLKTDYDGGEQSN